MSSLPFVLSHVGGFAKVTFKSRPEALDALNAALGERQKPGRKLITFEISEWRPADKEKKREEHKKQVNELTNRKQQVEEVVLDEPETETVQVLRSIKIPSNHFQVLHDQKIERVHSKKQVSQKNAERSERSRETNAKLTKALREAKARLASELMESNAEHYDHGYNRMVDAEGMPGYLTCEPCKLNLHQNAVIHHVNSPNHLMNLTAFKERELNIKLICLPFDKPEKETSN